MHGRGQRVGLAGVGRGEGGRVRRDQDLAAALRVIERELVGKVRVGGDSSLVEHDRAVGARPDRYLPEVAGLDGGGERRVPGLAVEQAVSHDEQADVTVCVPADVAGAVFVAERTANQGSVDRGAALVNRLSGRAQGR
jgi:hypothetical protein